MEKVHGNIYRGMKTKTINSIIKGKITDWLKSIEDEEVRSLAKRNTIVTGGCIASMLRGEPVNDFDIYFKDRETAFKVTRYYMSRFDPKNKNGINCKMYVANGCGKELTSYEDLGSEFTSETKEGRLKIIIKSAGIASEEGTTKDYEYFEGRPAEEASSYVSDVTGITETGDVSEDYEETERKAQEEMDDGPKYRPVFMSSNAITLSNKIQCIIRFWGEPDKIHENYDFVHCTNYWTSYEEKLNLRKEALEAIMAKELRYIGSRYPICSLIRLRKFIKRDWTINAGQILKMVMQVQKLDLSNVHVLEDQLTGVDTAYFSQVLNQLKSKDSTAIDSAYLVEIIDRMF